MTISQIEREDMESRSKLARINPKMPMVPFGLNNGEWEVLKSMYKPGDKIVSFVSDKSSWKHHAGQSGYALVRAGCIVKQIIDWQN